MVALKKKPGTQREGGCPGDFKQGRPSTLRILGCAPHQCPLICLNMDSRTQGECEKDQSLSRASQGTQMAAGCSIDKLGHKALSRGIWLYVVGSRKVQGYRHNSPRTLFPHTQGRWNILSEFSYMLPPAPHNPTPFSCGLKSCPRGWKVN